MAKKDVHVTPRTEGWAVKISGNSKASKVLDNQKTSYRLWQRDCEGKYFGTDYT